MQTILKVIWDMGVIELHDDGKLLQGNEWRYALEPKGLVRPTLGHLSGRRWMEDRHFMHMLTSVNWLLFWFLNGFRSHLWASVLQIFSVRSTPLIDLPSCYKLKWWLQPCKLHSKITQNDTVHFIVTVQYCLPHTDSGGRHLTGEPSPTASECESNEKIAMRVPSSTCRKYSHTDRSTVARGTVPA